VLTIRLSRVGAKRDPHYRVVVTDRASGRDGRFLEIVGHYHPRRQPAEVVFNVERTEAWLSQGARMSDTVRSLYRAVTSGTEQPSPDQEAKAPVPAEVTEAAAEAESAEAAAEAGAEADVTESGDETDAAEEAPDVDASPPADAEPSEQEQG